MPPASTVRCTSSLSTPSPILVRARTFARTTRESTQRIFPFRRYTGQFLTIHRFSSKYLAKRILAAIYQRRHSAPRNFVAKLHRERGARLDCNGSRDASVGIKIEPRKIDRAISLSRKVAVFFFFFSLQRNNRHYDGIFSRGIYFFRRASRHSPRRGRKSPPLINCRDAEGFLPKVSRGIGPLILSDSRHCNPAAVRVVRARTKESAPPPSHPPPPPSSRLRRPSLTYSARKEISRRSFSNIGVVRTCTCNNIDKEESMKYLVRPSVR